MATSSPELIRNCRRCARELGIGDLVCSHCHALVHSEELERLAAEARELESKKDFRAARERWLSGLRLLPHDSKQASWIVQHARELDEVASRVQPPPAESSENKWAQRLGPVGPVAILLAKSKGLMAAVFKLKFLLSFVAFFGVYWSLYGWQFGLGFTLLILIHEMGHFIDIKRRGLPAEMPVFLPGLGAYVRWRALGVTLETRAAVSLAGPLAGLLASIVCGLLWWQTGNALWAALARASAFLNLLNLIPVWVLDGGQAALALSKMERMLLLTACIALWLLLRENLYFLVAIGAGYSAFFARDLPPHPSRMTLIYFASVLAGLGGLLHFLPGQGFGGN